MSTNRQPDSKPTVRENGIFRGALKTIILSALYNLSDDQVEHQIRDVG